MSKDKGGRTLKKSPVEKTSGKAKVVSDYKNEGKGKSDNPTIEAFHPKPKSH